VLQDNNYGDIFIVEPNVDEHKVFKLTNYKDAMQHADIIALLVAHDEFKSLEFKANQEVLDFCGVNIAIRSK
jgi:UDP-N-acetyl-D-mannosaminuronic acid dehydrogenase